MRLDPALLLAAVPLLLLTACGGDEPPTRSKDIEPGPTCQTQGTIEAEPVSGLRAAVRPYLEPGDEMSITERFGSTAEVQLTGGPAPGVVTLVQTEQGWVVTSVSRC